MRSGEFKIGVAAINHFGVVYTRSMIPGGVALGQDCVIGQLHARTLQRCV